MAFCANALDAESKAAHTKARNLCILLSSSWPPPVCTENIIALISRKNHLTSMDHVRTVLLRPVRFGLAIQIEEPA